MGLYNLGYLLKQIRKEKHISQGDMCKGLCTVGMASRIENQERIPNRKLAEALFSRLGEAAPAGGIPMTKADFTMRNLESEMGAKVTYGQYEITDLLDAYKNAKETLSNLELQFYELYYTFYLDRNSDRTECSLAQLVTSLQRTKQDFVLQEPFDFGLLTHTEFIILNNIARSLYQLEKKDTAVALMSYLKSYFEKALVNPIRKAKNLSLICFNLANWQEMAGNRTVALELSEQGEKRCLQSNYLSDFPYHIFNEGYCLAQLGEKEKAKPLFSDAFTIFDVIGRHDNSIYGIPIINKQFGYDFSIE